MRILRWKEKYDQIPEDTKDPGLLRARKDLKRKQPIRRSTVQYWQESQFQSLLKAPPGKLTSKGPLPWRLLAYYLDATPEIEPIRKLVGKRLMDSGRLVQGQRTLDHMLLTLWAAGYVTLDPPPPAAAEGTGDGGQETGQNVPKKQTETERLMEQALKELRAEKTPSDSSSPVPSPPSPVPSPSSYQSLYAHPTPELAKLVQLRGINPLYAVYLVNQLGIADRNERMQALESVLEMPGSVAKHVRVPWPEDMPPGPLAKTRIDEQLLTMGLATAEQLGQKPPKEDEDDKRRGGMFEEERVRVLHLAEKLRLLFDATFP